MPISEKDRLDLRQALEVLLEDQRLANIAMDAMPPLDYPQFATKTDVENLGIVMRGEMSELRGEMSELRGELKGEIARLDLSMANQMRILLAGQLVSMMMLGAWVAAIT